MGDKIIYSILEKTQDGITQKHSQLSYSTTQKIYHKPNKQETKFKNTRGEVDR